MKYRNVLCFVAAMLFLLSSNAFSQSRARRVSTPPPVTPTNIPTEQPASPTQSSDAGEEVGENETIRVDTALVTIPVSVSDRDGRFIYDLGKEEFSVYENGVPQQIKYFGTVEQPFTVVLMIDTSASTWGKLDEIKDSAIAFLEQLRPEDKVMVVSFAGKVSVICDPTSDRQYLRNSIARIGRGSSTRLYDSVERVMNREISRFKGRKAIVLFTDGVDATSDRESVGSNLADAEELDAVIYPIYYDTYDPYKDDNGGGGWGRQYPQRRRGSRGIILNFPFPFPVPGTGGGNGPIGGGGGGTGSSREEYEVGRNYLYDLAKLTGGRVFEATQNRQSIDEAFHNIAEELRHQYSLGYQPNTKAAAGERRSIKVRVSRPAVAVRSRDSYIYNPGGAAPSQQADSTQTGDQPKAPPVLRRPLANTTQP